MTTFSKANFKAGKYAQFRPQYPGSFYNILGNYISQVQSVPVQKTVDIGCGTGVASIPLLSISKQVIGVDLSPTMIEKANDLKSKLPELEQNRLEFVTSDAANWQDSGVDLITIAQAIHWFDIPKFFGDCAKGLTKNGVVAYFYYVDPFVRGIDQSEEISKLYNKYVYGEEYMGPFWEQPGRDILKNMCEDVDKQIPEEFTDVTTNHYQADREITDDDLVMVRDEVTIEDYFNYIRTYSAYHNFQNSTGRGYDVLNSFRNDLHQLGLDDETKFELVWNTGYTFMRKK